MFDATRDGDRPRRRNAAAEGKGCHAPGMAAKGGSSKSGAKLKSVADARQVRTDKMPLGQTAGS